MGVNQNTKQKGFVLVATLWALAIMLIAVGFFHATVQRKLSVGLQAKIHMQDALDEYSTQQTLLYLLGTSRMTRAGLTFTQLTSEESNASDGIYSSDAVGDEILFDGTPYKGVGDIEFAIQDISGLISINAADLTNLDILLARYEPNLSVRTQLLNALKDYIDVDDLISLAGAEKQDYVASGMALPTNDYLRSEPELARVYGWREWLAAHSEFDVQYSLGIRQFSELNFNAMPKLLFQNFLGFSEELADRIILERKTNPFRSVDDFLLRTNIIATLNEDHYRFFPTNDLRLSFWNKGGGQARLISLQLTPNGLLGPWQVDYEYSVQSVENNNEALAIRQSILFNSALGDDITGH